MSVLITLTVSDGTHELRKVKMVVSEDLETPLIESAIGYARYAREDAGKWQIPAGIGYEEQTELRALGMCCHRSRKRSHDR